ncbi:T9SS type A sorting domain-containing protein [Botryobacter ruber]|uniref:T9SS type A sorting domain-containing protein n=1 Tax=Botryobacter ruber TaxID=2171629 RepID=UPI0013E3459E|nr:T9SS type A sorting domain-containing protein [Botryobacter ruber]
MKIYILLFSFLLTSLTASAQSSNCSESQPRPITGNQHPCAGSIETYCIENDRNYTSFEWDVPRAQAGEPPVGWEIISGQNTNCVTVRVGEKSGTMKVKVTDPICGTKVATLPVKPGKSFEVTINGPETVCINQEQTYTATLSEKQKGNNKSDFTFTWTYPADWTVVEDGNPNDGRLTVIPGSTSGTVNVYVEDTANKTDKGNNGNGVGGTKGYCGTASDAIAVTTEDCDGNEEPICVITTDDGLFTFGFMGATNNTDNTTTVRFSFENNTASAMELATIEIPDAPQPIEPIAPEGFIAEVDAENGLITYIRIDGETQGNETEIFGFTIPTESHELLPFYTLGVFTTGGDSGFTGFNTITCDDSPINPLPVELSSFDGKATASGIELTWTTASETDNDKFEVERSTDGKEYTAIGTVKGAGNSSTTLTYSFSDKSAAKGINYYRVKQVDFDGTSQLSKVIALENSNAPKTAGVTLYPNPVTGNNVNIALGGSDYSNKTFVVTITDMNGRKVMEQQISTAGSDAVNLSLDQARVTKGLYMVKIQGDNLLETQKLLVR